MSCWKLLHRWGLSFIAHRTVFLDRGPHGSERNRTTVSPRNAGRPVGRRGPSWAPLACRPRSTCWDGSRQDGDAVGAGKSSAEDNQSPAGGSVLVPPYCHDAKPSFRVSTVMLAEVKFNFPDMQRSHGHVLLLPLPSSRPPAPEEPQSYGKRINFKFINCHSCIDIFLYILYTHGFMSVFLSL